MKAAIVTGAGSGIGAGVAQKLAARGEIVIASDRDGATAARTLDAIVAAGGAGDAVTADVTREEDMLALVARAVEGGRALATVVACAGVAATGSVVGMSKDSFSTVIDVNLGGVFLLAKAAMPRLEDGGGTFTAILSDAALDGFQDYAAYCASKHGALGLVKVLALDHGPKGVRSNAICPGYVETPMLDRLMAKLGSERAEFERGVPLGRLATVADVANMVDFVTSAAGGYINGAILSLDGGTSAGPYTLA